MIADFDEMVKKEPQEEMPMLEEEIPPSSSHPPKLEKNLSYNELLLDQAEEVVGNGVVQDKVVENNVEDEV